MRTRMAVAAWLSLLAVLYATLMPFEFGNQSVSDALSHFTSLSLPQMSASARQQWVANVLMFLPLGFFWTAWLSGYVHGVAGRLLVAVLVALLALATTATVEFLQFWLPRREPSLLDMSGNLTGGLVGVLVWYGLSDPGRRWLAVLRQGGVGALRRGLLIYAFVYVLLAWLPLDIMLSWQEVIWKLESDGWGLWRAPVSEDSVVRWWVLRSMVLVMSVPIGVLIGWWLTAHLPSFAGSRIFILALMSGVVLAAVVEVGQFLTVSGVAEGGSVLARLLGLALGVWLFVRRMCFDFDRLRFCTRPAVVVLLLPYLALAVVLNLGGEGFAMETASVLAKLESVNFLPFWYHYMVSEAEAIGSVLLHLAMYAPVGVAMWLWRWGLRGITPGGGLWAAVFLAVILALAMEAGKLFMAGLRPDPTNLWIAAAAAWSGWQICGTVWWGLRGIRDWEYGGVNVPSGSAVQDRSSRRYSAEGGVKYPGIKPADPGFVRGAEDAVRQRATVFPGDPYGLGKCRRH
ncbi:VanZ family protein [Ectothiorhodospira haloalkaliphila]|uniref:VanZ family protein n=1 Tax=Ectothiorhodospira haloalkaliphila TaxID=421628 RepID=UPI001EE7D725|nr:VanZ family protein [Ectothiorhodospira haloalkaliphila]MCG5524327.1 VanZ family protein [Ectothiorhodospira haloalkaliphila]